MGIWAAFVRLMNGLADSKARLRDPDRVVGEGLFTFISRVMDVWNF
jgi:hypothetical protein